MKHHHLFVVLLSLFIIVSCRKVDFKNDNESSSQYGLKEKILGFLSERQKKVSLSTSEKIEKLKSKINWDEILTRSRSMGGSEAFIELFDNKLPNARIETNTYSTLCVEQDVNGNITLVSTFEMVNSDTTANQNNLLSDLVNSCN